MAATALQSVAANFSGRSRAEISLRPLVVGLAGRLAWGILLLAAATVVSRRLAGGLESPPGVLVILAVAAAGIGLVLLSDHISPAARPGRTDCGNSPPPQDAAIGNPKNPWRFWGLPKWTIPRPHSRARAMDGFFHGQLAGWLARGCLLAVLGGLGLFATHPGTAVVTGLLMLFASVGLTASDVWRPRLPAALTPPLGWPGWTWPNRQPRPPAIRPVAAPGPRPQPLAGQLLQWQERYRLADGQEQLRGQLVVTLAAESRLATGHVGFCPAFPMIPDVTVSTDYDALEVAVTAAEVLPWGVRVECRVEDPADEPVAIPIDLSISLAANSAAGPSDTPPEND